MRLIDADAFAIEEPKLWDWSSVDGISSTAVLKQCIWDVQCAPTVKAIPVEWLKRWFETQVWRGSSPTDRIHCKASDIIEDWEKENEK